uniref:hypothetical protein n=1 Tax=Trichloromonas sp. TaxID=3069249 RepID=UPI003D81B967
MSTPGESSPISRPLGPGKKYLRNLRLRLKSPYPAFMLDGAAPPADENNALEGFVTTTRGGFPILRESPA